MCSYSIFPKATIPIFLILTRKRGGDAPSLLIQALKSSNKLSHMKICWLVWLARLPVNTVCCAFQVLSHRQLPNKYNLWPQAGKRCQACQQKASCNVPQRTPCTTNCYRLMAPFNTKNLLHRHPLCNPSFPMLCAPTAQLHWNVFLLLLLTYAWEGSWSKVKSWHQARRVAISIKGGETLPKGSSAQRNRHSHLVMFLHAELD